ncbi:MAG: MotA/TolQ/ExbB proton channel family protein [Planctomycetota bacterium]|nr:MotA/TolQ/ExbB proton channel family protein [Planctomycetota bacterium]
MNQGVWETIAKTFSAGGWVMWPLLALSVLSVALSVERTIFWVSTDRPGRRGWLSQLAGYLRRGDAAAARSFVAGDRSVYARVARAILDRGASEALAVEAVEEHRGSLERFSPALSTIITAAPLLGILGTVTGIIASFRLLGGSDGNGPITDPSMVAAGIAEALITTAFGLVVAMLTLFPYVVFKARADAALGKLEGMCAAAIHAAGARKEEGRVAAPGREEGASGGRVRDLAAAGSERD